MPLPT